MKTSSITGAGLRALLLAACALACAVPSPQALGAPGFTSGGEQVRGNGNIKRQAREMGHFTGVELAVTGKAELRLGTTETVTIETDDNLLPLLETVVEDGTLKIRPARRTLSFQTRTLKIVVHAREIERVAIGGSASLDADALRAPRLQFDLNGSGSVNIKAIDSDAVGVSVRGSGDLKAGGGTVRRLSVSIAGSSNVELGQVRAEQASISIDGSGEATVWARDALSLTIAGSGDVNYYGDPKISKSVAGSGGLRRLGDAPR